MIEFLKSFGTTTAAVAVVFGSMFGLIYIAHVLGFY